MGEWFFLAPPQQVKKGRGKGHWGHKGRPGKVGGSLPSRDKGETPDADSLESAYGDKVVVYTDINRGGGRYIGDKDSVYNVEIVPGEAIRIHGEAHTSKRKKRKFDLIFKVGDKARATTGQLAKRRNEILKITRKTIVVKNQYGSSKRRKLYDFSFDNCFGDEIHVLPTW